MSSKHDISVRRQDTQKANGEPVQAQDYTKVKVLALTFEFTDLEIEPETENVISAFKNRGYGVRHYKIKMQDSWGELEKELDEFFKRDDRTPLCILYYNGHGGIEDGKRLVFSSHNIPDDVGELWETIKTIWGKPGNLSQLLKEAESPFQKPAEIEWEEIIIRMMKCPHDVLVILDCCDAGLAAACSQERYDQGPPATTRKELIGACGWGVDAGYHMSPALSKVIEEGFPRAESSMSTPTLIRRMNNLLAKKLKDGKTGQPTQGVHYLLQRNSEDKMILPNLKPQAHTQA